MKRIRPVTVLLLAMILVLGYSLVTRQRREARLRAALALYKSRATGEIAGLMANRSPAIALDWPERHPAGRGDRADQERNGVRAFLQRAPHSSSTRTGSGRPGSR